MNEDRVLVKLTVYNSIAVTVSCKYITWYEKIHCSVQLSHVHNLQMYMQIL